MFIALPLLAIFGFVEFGLRLVLAIPLVAIDMTIGIDDFFLEEWMKPIAWKTMRDLAAPPTPQGDNPDANS